MIPGTWTQEKITKTKNAPREGIALRVPLQIFVEFR